MNKEEILALLDERDVEKAEAAKKEAEEAEKEKEKSATEKLAELEKENEKLKGELSEAQKVIETKETKVKVEAKGVLIK